MGLLSCRPAGLAGQNTTSRAPRTPAEIAEAAKNSIVRIGDNQSRGAGFVVWKDGRIATNLHVITAMREPQIELPDGRVIKHDKIEVMAIDTAHDLAVLRVPARNLTPAVFGDVDKVRAGDRVVAIGYPSGLGNTVSDGLVSAVRIKGGVKLLQITAPIAPGSSGGPVMNEAGEVIAVATLVVQGEQNLNFAVPVDYLKPMLLQERPVSYLQFRQELTQIAFMQGCSPEGVQAAVTAILAAIKIGVPTYNSGDHRGCYDIYQKTAATLVARKDACANLSEILNTGLKDAKGVATPGEKAWAVRHAFDRVLVIVGEALGSPLFR